MKVGNEFLAVETTPNGEIKSVKYLGKEMLHDGQKYWAKTYPMVWPTTSFSRAFEVDGINYELPKHGFWKEMSWEQMYEGESLLLVATHVADTTYPFTIDIQEKIALDKSQIIISTTFSNLSKTSAAFNFGHHPAFNIDADSEFSFSQKVEPEFFGLKQTPEQFGKIMKMGFGDKYDTIVFHHAKGLATEFVYDHVKVKVTSKDFDSTQLWKPKEADFVCVEPWQGYNDDEYEYPHDALQKRETIILPSGKSITKTILIEFSKVDLN